MSRYRANTSAMGMHVILTGNPAEGLEIFGPFKTGAEAAEFGNTYLADDWWIMPLQSPDACSAGEPQHRRSIPSRAF